MAEPKPAFQDLLSAHQSGHALAQSFYTNSDVFGHDVDEVFYKDWHLAGHISELALPGDYFLFEMLQESVIINRDDLGQIHGLANVCRHRGSRVCIEPRGNTKRFTCPYHAWAYNLDGSLFNARHLPPEIDRTKLGLRPIATHVFHGFIFVSFAQDPTSFAALHRDLDPILTPFGLARTKIAHRMVYPVKANWKLLVENYNECYHCATAHPEFSRSHPTHMAPDRVAPMNEAMQARSTACGIRTDYIDAIGSARPDHAPDYAYNRYSLYEGYKTGSQTGSALAPLLGDIKGYDGGASDLYVGILNPMLIYCDHAVVYRFISIDKDHSAQEIIWMVHEDAQVGRDYDLDRLLWLWDLTTIADKKIIEKNQEGVNSRYYTPGPFVDMEAYAKRFVDSYLMSFKLDEID